MATKKTRDTDDEVRMLTKLDVGEALILDALRIYKVTPRSGKQAEALHALETAEQSIAMFRILRRAR